jgi:hypothetical protein
MRLHFFSKRHEALGGGHTVGPFVICNVAVVFATELVALYGIVVVFLELNLSPGFST